MSKGQQSHQPRSMKYPPEAYRDVASWERGITDGCEDYKAGDTAEPTGNAAYRAGYREGLKRAEHSNKTGRSL